MIHKWLSIGCLVLLLLVSAWIMSDEEEEILPLSKVTFLLALFIPLLYVALH